MAAPVHKLYLPDADARRARLAELEARELALRNEIGAIRDEVRLLDPSVEDRELAELDAFGERLRAFLNGEFDRLETEIGDIEAGAVILANLAEETATLCKALGTGLDDTVSQMREVFAAAPTPEELAGLPSPEEVRH